MEKTCKKCGRILPESYKHNCCENCRNKKAQKAKDIAKGALGVGVTVGGFVLAVVTKGKIDPKGKA